MAPSASGSDDWNYFFESDIPRECLRRPWFDDGNIILMTSEGADAANPVAFKVHRSVLARHSEIFASMFEGAQPEGTWNPQSGPPVVRVYDLPLELANLILALYDGVQFQTKAIEDFYFLAGILRLSTKYMIAHLRNQCIRHLSSIWAHTLKGHDTMVDLAIQSEIVDGLTFPYIHPLHVLNLARETNVRLVVPSALYFLTVYPLADILKADHPKLTVAHPSQPSAALSPSDLRDYTLMYQHRLDLVLRFHHSFLLERKAGSDCVYLSALYAYSPDVSKDRCTRAFTKHGIKMSRSWGPKMGVLHWQLQAIKYVSDDDEICRTCRKHFQDDVNGLRQQIWDALPSVVGLPGWAELEREDLDPLPSEDSSSSNLGIPLVEGSSFTRPGHPRSTPSLR